jgi:aminoglycoside phosphotransferase (APT) family kinase protein
MHGRGVGAVGISSTINLANQARGQLLAAIEACDTSGEALGRTIAVLTQVDDLDGPLVASRQAVAAWRDEMRTVSTELGEIANELGRLVDDLTAIQLRLAPVDRGTS